MGRRAIIGGSWEIQDPQWLEQPEQEPPQEWVDEQQHMKWLLQLLSRNCIAMWGSYHCEPNKATSFVGDFDSNTRMLALGSYPGGEQQTPSRAPIDSGLTALDSVVTANAAMPSDARSMVQHMEQATPQVIAVPDPNTELLAQIYGSNQVPDGAGVTPLATWDPDRDRCRNGGCWQDPVWIESLGVMGQQSIYAVEQRSAFGRPAWYLRLASPAQEQPWSSRWMQVLGQQLQLTQTEQASERVTIVGGDAYGVVVISDTQWDPSAFDVFNGGQAQGVHRFELLYIGSDMTLDVGEDLLDSNQTYFAPRSGIAGKYLSSAQIEQWMNDPRLQEVTFATEQAVHFTQSLQLLSWPHHTLMAKHIRFDGYVLLGASRFYAMDGIEFNDGVYPNDSPTLVTLGQIKFKEPLTIAEMNAFAGQGIHVDGDFALMSSMRLVNHFMGDTIRLPAITIDVAGTLNLGPQGHISYSQGGFSEENYDEAARLGNPYWPESVGNSSIWECARMSGGGALRIKAQALENEGRISVNGDVSDHDIHSCWAGSGGSLIVQTERLSGNGDFTSLGYSNGRMAIYAQNNQFTGQYRAATAWVAANPQHIGVLHMNAEQNSAESMEWPNIPMQQIAYIQSMGRNDAEEALWQLGVTNGAHAQWPQLAGGQGTSLVGSYLTTNWQDATPTYARVVEQHSDSLVVALPVGIDLSDWAGKTMISAHRFNSVLMPSNQQEWRQLNFGHARLDIIQPEQSEIKANEVRSSYIEAGLAQWFASQGITWKDGTQPRW
jgi:hypothetical protein